MSENTTRGGEPQSIGEILSFADLLKEPEWRRCPNCEDNHDASRFEGEICGWCAEQRRMAEAELKRLTTGLPDGLTGRRAGMLYHAGVPARYCAEPKPGFELDRVLLERPVRMVYLWGPFRAGKSTTAAELVYQELLANKASEVEWHSAGHLAGRLISGQDRESDLAECRLLVLEDLGRGHPRGLWLPLVRILVERDQHWRTTIVTSEMNLTTLAEENTGGEIDLGALVWRLAEGKEVEVSR